MLDVHQTLKYMGPLKESRAPWRNIDFRVGAGKMHTEMGTFFVLESKEVLRNKMMGVCQRDTGAN